MKLDYNYSVIVPHRNSLATLGRALKSIPIRQDIQIIVVDNSDIPIVPIDVPIGVELYFSDFNLGAGCARNIGMTAVKGKWILFLDADDFFTPNAFSTFDNYLDTEHEIIFFSIYRAFSDTLETLQNDNYINRQIREFLKAGQKKMNCDYKLRLRHYPPWAKMVSSSLVFANSYSFDQTITANDVMFSATVGYGAFSIGASSEIVYCHTIHQGSLMLIVSKDSLFSKYRVLLEYNKYLITIDKGALRVPISSYIIRSFSYGFVEFCKYIKLAFLNRVSFFLELKYLPKEVLKMVVKRRFCQYEIRR